jgi:SOS-response transcriptional repressor LexA
MVAHNRCDWSHRQGVIWRIFPPPAQAWDISPMSQTLDMAAIREALSKAMKDKKIAPKRLSIDAGLGETAVRDIMKADSQDVRVGTLVRLASVLDVQLEDLLGAPRVPIVGYIGAGGSVIFEDQGSDETVMRPPAISGPVIALEVRGESMLPKYEPGDIVYIQRTHDGVLPVYVGQYCAVRLKSGETYIKRLAYGSRPGVFTLQSLNAADIADVEVEWATPVLFIMPYVSRSL